MTKLLLFQRATTLAVTASLAGVVTASPLEAVQAGSPPAAESGPAIGARADLLLRSMSDYLGAAQEFSFRADVAYDSVATDGQKIQYGGTANISVRRPDRLRVLYEGDERPRQVIVAGETFTMLDRENNVYASASVPGELGAALDHIFERYGFSVPIADLIYPDPYRTLTGSVQAGSVVGRHRVAGAPCHHLAFTQEGIDWQIWIEDGPAPLPRKLVITYKDEPGSPQYSATLSEWDLEPRISKGYFEFQPPAGSGEIEFLPGPGEDQE
jgi:hypothetical protein